MNTQRESRPGGQDRSGNDQIDSLTSYLLTQDRVKDWGPWADPWMAEFDEPAAVRS